MVEIGKTYVSKNGLGEVCERMTVKGILDTPHPDVRFMNCERKTFFGQGRDLRQQKDFQYYVSYAFYNNAWICTTYQQREEDGTNVPVD